jgi:hypothetical protein
LERWRAIYFSLTLFFENALFDNFFHAFFYIFLQRALLPARQDGGPSKARFLPSSWVACENGFSQPSSPSLGAGVIDVLLKGAIRRGLAFLFCGPRLCAIGDERSSGLTGGRPRSAPGELEVTFDALARNQPIPFLGSVSATPANSQLLPLGLLAPSSAAQGDTCSLTTQHTRTPTPPGRPRMIHLIHAHSQSTLRFTAISLERSGGGCLCRRTAAVGSTISFTCSIAGARAERPGVKLTSLLS